MNVLWYDTSKRENILSYKGREHKKVKQCYVKLCLKICELMCKLLATLLNFKRSMIKGETFTNHLKKEWMKTRGDFTKFQNCLYPFWFKHILTYTPNSSDKKNIFIEYSIYLLIHAIIKLIQWLMFYHHQKERDCWLLGWFLW